MTAKDSKSSPKPIHAKLMVDNNRHLVLLAMAGPEIPLRAEAPIHWFVRVPGEAWTLIEPGDALKQIDRYGGFARLDLTELKLATKVKEVQLGCSTAAEHHPSGQHVTWSLDHVVDPPETVEHRIPDEPIFIDGGSSGGGEPPPTRVEVSMSRSRVPNTSDEILWVVIRNSANSLGFDSYQQWMDGLFLQHKRPTPTVRELREVGDTMLLERFHFASTDAYRVLKFATELFVKTHCGVIPDPDQPLQIDAADEEARFGHLLPKTFRDLWEQDYLVRLGPPEAPRALILPYLDLIHRKLGDLGTVRSRHALVDQQAGLLQDKLVHPVLLELIWSYWMEEGMLVQGFNTIVRRFQNVRAPGDRDPLVQLEIDALRPLNHLLWGWVQDEINQLSVLRRAHEYDHQYGFTLHGKAVAELRTADRRSKFLEAFHNLLWRCIQFYRQDDDTTVIADGFTVLNAIKETHYLLAQGAHNQFGDLPATARREMLMQQWLLSRPEMREFLGGRVAVAYPESWMDRVDALKAIKGWTATSVVHFRDLAVFGEQLLLSIRWGAWSTILDPSSAANWARYWRSEVQGYVHAYRAVTGVDLTAEITDQRQAEQRFLPPSVHLRRMLAQAAR